MSEFNEMMAVNELVEPSLKHMRRKDVFTQKQAVENVLNLLGDEMSLEDLADLASQEYGRRVTPGRAYHFRCLWRKERDEDLKPVCQITGKTNVFDVIDIVKQALNRIGNFATANVWVEKAINKVHDLPAVVTLARKYVDVA